MSKSVPRPPEYRIRELVYRPPNLSKIARRATFDAVIFMVLLGLLLWLIL